MESLLLPLVGVQAKAFAQQLIKRFGGLSQALSASPDVQGLQEAERQALEVVRAANDLVTAACSERIARSTMDSRDPGLIKYLQIKLGSLENEAILALFGDAEAGYIDAEFVGSGGASAVQLPARRITKRAIELGANSLLLAHNHPSGCELPSAADYEATDRLRQALNAIEIKLLDHLVVTRGAVFSIKDGTRR